MIKGNYFEKIKKFKINFPIFRLFLLDDSLSMDSVYLFILWHTQPMAVLGYMNTKMPKFETILILNNIDS